MQFATGVSEVFVNGTQVLKGGEPTGATPGRFLKGPGWTGWPGGGACAQGGRRDTTGRQNLPNGLKRS
jgi:N-acyl-D-amino-acid deacylase